LAKSLVATGEIELMSTTILPGVKPSATPSLATSGVSGTMTMTMSAFCATSFDEAHVLPREASSAGTPDRL